MDSNEFCAKFNKAFPKGTVSKPVVLYDNRILRFFFDTCPKVKGLTSIRNQKLLNIAFSCVGMDECYLEIGTYLGKSLISAMLGNPRKKTYACDDFSQFTSTNSLEKLQKNLGIYKLDKDVTFYNSDFLEILNKEKIPFPIGVCFYDGAHDEKSQYLAIKKIEPLLSQEAVVIVDDWRFAEDSQSFAKTGTENAVKESSNEWRVLYNLPARYNGDYGMWWNGICVLSFKRRTI